MKLPSCLLGSLLPFVAVLSMPSIAPAQVILIDFGIPGAGFATVSPDANGNYWNNVTSSAAATTIANLTTSADTLSGIKLEITTGFSNTGPSPYATLTGESSLGALNIGTAISDFLFVNNNLATPAVVTFSNLDPTKTYNFSIFGSRNATDTRNTTYVVAGANSDTQSLTTSGTDIGGTGINYNDSSLALINGIIPNGSNSITLSVSSAGLGYLNALQITVVPEPGTAALFLGGAALLFVSKVTRPRRA